MCVCKIIGPRRPATEGWALVAADGAGEHGTVKVRRFKVEQIPDDADTIRVSGTEAHHAHAVLRLKSGDQVCFFDGHGTEALGVIKSIDRKHMIVRIDQPGRAVKHTGSALFIATAIPKGERADWMIEKCAELGAMALIPLRYARSQVIPGEAKIGRWRRKADEAAKQSGQAAVMRIEAVTELAGAIRDAAARGPVFFGDPRGNTASLLSALEKLNSSTSQKEAATIFIGPEGGLTDEEISQIESAGGKPVRLAASILRIETAAVAVAAAWAMSE